MEIHEEMHAVKSNMDSMVESGQLVDYKINHIEYDFVAGTKTIDVSVQPVITIDRIAMSCGVSV